MSVSAFNSRFADCAALSVSVIVMSDLGSAFCCVIYFFRLVLQFDAFCIVEYSLCQEFVENMSVRFYFIITGYSSKTTGIWFTKIKEEILSSCLHCWILENLLAWLFMDCRHWTPLACIMMLVHPFLYAIIDSNSLIGWMHCLIDLSFFRYLLLLYTVELCSMQAVKFEVWILFKCLRKEHHIMCPVRPNLKATDACISGFSLQVSN